MLLLPDPTNILLSFISGTLYRAVQLCQMENQNQTRLKPVYKTMESEYECATKCLSIKTCNTFNYDRRTRVCNLATADSVMMNDAVHYFVGPCSAVALHTPSATLESGSKS